MNLRFFCWKASIFIVKLMVSSWFLHLIHVIYLAFFYVSEGASGLMFFGGFKKKNQMAELP